MTVIVSGMVAGTPGQAGASWSVLQWVLGLRELGHRAVLVEEVAFDRLEPGGTPFTLSRNSRDFLSMTRALGIEDACLMLSGTTETVGMSYEAVLGAAGSCDCLINISGTLRDERILDKIPIRAYLDVDPCFTQLWELQGHDLGLARHNRFVTLGLSIGRPGCPVPTNGRQWLTTLPPVVLEYWPEVDALPAKQFSTVVNWRGYGSVERDGIFYGQKVHSFRHFFALPTLTGARFELACAIGPAEERDLSELNGNGWRLVDPSAVAGTADGYRNYVGSSLAELNVAKSGYVKSLSGWFSDRSACYLASGRPVVAQHTGLPEYLRPEEGFLTFSTLEEAAEAVSEVVENYPRHRKAARSFAEEHLDSRRVVDKVLRDLLS